MEWWASQLVALLVVTAVHISVSLAVMLYRRRMQLNIREESTKRRAGGSTLQSVYNNNITDLPAGIIGLQFREQTAHGVEAKAGDMFFRNFFNAEDDIVQLQEMQSTLEAPGHFQHAAPQAAADAAPVEAKE